MGLLDLVFWICFLSFFEWTKSSMCNSYLHTRFMHIRCALCFLLGLEGGGVRGWRGNFLFFCFFLGSGAPKGNISGTCLGFYVGECQMIQKNWWWTNQWSSFFSKLIKKKLWVQPHLLLYFALTTWSASQVLFYIYFILLQWANLIGPLLKKKKEYGGSPK